MAVQEKRESKVDFDLDFAAPGFLDDPYPLYHALRDHDPVFRSPWGEWYLTRYDDVAAVLTDKKFLRESPNGANPMSAEVREQTSMDRMLSRWMVFVDPPTHTRLRGLVGKAFTPKFVQNMAPQIQLLTNQLLDDAARQSTFDLVHDLAYPLPVIVISRMLGVAEEDYELLKDWSGKLTKGLDTGHLTELAQGVEATDEISSYVGDLISSRRAAPRDDLVSKLIAASDESMSVSDDELVANIVMLLWAGHETTKNLIGNGILALLRNPDQLQILTENPDLMGTAVEELLRLDSPVQKIVRWTKVPTALGDHTIPSGQCIVNLLGAANRDPEQFSEPDRLNIMRRKRSNLGFGRGIHYCLGFAIARMEAEIAITSLLSATKFLALKEKTVSWQPTTSIRGLSRLPLDAKWQ